MNKALSVNDVRGVTEPEPTIVEITFVLDDGSTATLRMNVFTLQKLSQVIRPVAQKY